MAKVFHKLDFNTETRRDLNIFSVDFVFHLCQLLRPCPGWLPKRLLPLVLPLKSFGPEPLMVVLRHLNLTPRPLKNGRIC